MDTDQQWPAFSDAAAVHGIQSSVSTPLLARHEGVGAFNKAASSEEDVAIALQSRPRRRSCSRNARAY
jgi:hypothetical protein